MYLPEFEQRTAGTDYTRASSGLAELKQRKQGDLAFLAGSHTD